jgi:hypothetical protein
MLESSENRQPSWIRGLRDWQQISVVHCVILGGIMFAGPLSGDE